MQTNMFRSLLHFFEGTGRVLSTPSGDARGHVRVYVAGKVRSDRNF